MATKIACCVINWKCSIITSINNNNIYDGDDVDDDNNNNNANDNNISPLVSSTGDRKHRNRMYHSTRNRNSLMDSNTFWMFVVVFMIFFNQINCINLENTIWKEKLPKIILSGGLFQLNGYLQIKQYCLTEFLYLEFYYF